MKYLYSASGNFSLAALTISRRALFALLLCFSNLMPLHAEEAPEPLTPCTAEPTDMTINFGDLIDCNIDVVSDSDNFRFAGAADTMVVVSLLHPTANGNYEYRYTRPLAYLYAPDSTTPLVTVIPDPYYNNMIADAKEVKLPVTGTYTIRVAEDGNNAVLPYRLGLERLIPASPTAKTICWNCSTGSLKLDPALDQDFFTFQAFKDATATLTLGDFSAGRCDVTRPVSSICPTARLFGPDQTLLGELGPGSQAKDIKLPVTGTYTIRVSEYGNNNPETYGLTLGCLFPPAGQTACGPAQSSTVTVDLTSSANPAPFGQPITFTGVVKNAQNPTGKLNFSLNGSAVASCTDLPLTNASANCTANGLAIGSYAILARYSGDSTNNAAQASLTQVVQAPPPGATYPLTVTKQGDGYVGSTPAGIDCGATCTNQLPIAAQVKLEATPARGFRFSGWSGACTGDAACVINMDGAKNVTAQFTELPVELPRFPLKVTRAATGIVTSSPEGINCGGKNKLCKGSFSRATLTATPLPGYGFKKWVGCPQPTGNTCAMTLTKATRIEASFFKLPKYALKLTKTRLGKVISSPPGLLCNVAKTRTCRGVFPSGTTVTLTAVPLTGFTFIGWSGACSGTAETCTFTMNGKKGVGATFQ